MANENKKTQASLETKLDKLTEILDQQKAVNPFIHKFSHSNDIADAMLIASATSRRHAQGIAKALLAACKDSGWDYLRMEGFESGQWILLDCNDLIIHIFQEEARDLYKLEDLWR